MGKMFNGKQFDEIEEDEDYKRLLVSSPIQAGENPEESKKVEEGLAELAVEQEDIPAGQVEELVGIIMGGQNEEDPVAEIETNEDNHVKEQDKKPDKDTNSEEKGAPTFKIEGKSFGPPGEKVERKVQPNKKVTKESKPAKSTQPPAQPANLSIMVLKKN
jgi:hypothetical protein